MRWNTIEFSKIAETTGHRETWNLQFCGLVKQSRLLCSMIQILLKTYMHYQNLMMVFFVDGDIPRKLNFLFLLFSIFFKNSLNKIYSHMKGSCSLFCS